ncbi:DUF1697 domain-containing protein [Gracilibacillus oryzae]|uniref:DUF1697 domain-containing protein n=1 Tax=Gracilibacillus oryzae TaxID=1672701 RepID=A0A7C8GQ00_9BACI|nr:DUF1697 domain-containing protein [Gracilibacillus oryzae]KAB8125743.1 DUF1697 domain-containing protein [Gracilibacillus oryzae]
MIYVAVLRGINVGGRNKIDMKQIKQSFERIGFESVKTYINTGNIMFRSDVMEREELIKKIEAVIVDDFQLDIKAVVRSIEEMDKVVAAIPNEWENDKTIKSDVLFLWEEVDKPTVMEELPIKQEFDQVIYISGAIIWSVKREFQSESGMLAIIGTKFYKQVTVRNVNTTRKVYDMMKGLAQ